MRSSELFMVSSRVVRSVREEDIGRNSLLAMESRSPQKVSSAKHFATCWTSSNGTTNFWRNRSGLVVERLLPMTSRGYCSGGASEFRPLLVFVVNAERSATADGLGPRGFGG